MLMLHAGADAIDYDGLRSIVTPERTETHVPLPHHELVNMVEYALGYHGHEVTKRQFGVTPDGARFFGVLALKSDYGDYTDMIGLANSHDKTVALSVCFGSQVFVCDNMAFSAETVIKRKHTANSRRMLPATIEEIISPLKQARIGQNMMFDRYKGRELSDDQAYATTVRMFLGGIINANRIPEVLGQWENPTCDWGPKTAYRLFNGATWSLKPKVADKPQLTQDLHALIDGVCA